MSNSPTGLLKWTVEHVRVTGTGAQCGLDVVSSETVQMRVSHVSLKSRLARTNMPHRAQTSLMFLFWESVSCFAARSRDLFN